MLPQYAAYDWIWFISFISCVPVANWHSQRRFDLCSRRCVLDACLARHSRAIRSSARGPVVRASRYSSRVFPASAGQLLRCLEQLPLLLIQASPLQLKAQRFNLQVLRRLQSLPSDFHGLTPAWLPRLSGASEFREARSRPAK